MNVGVYVDNANLTKNGGVGMRYDVLRDFACRDGAEAVRLNTYVPFDEERAEQDAQYRHKSWSYHAALRDFGFKVIQKPVRWFTDEDGNRFGKANADLDMAVDALLQSDKLDRVVLCTGDGDFVQVVKALQNKGCRVEVIAFNNVSGELRREADEFTSGFLIPNMLPVANMDLEQWGKVGGRARGVCNYHHPTKPFGFMRVMKQIGHQTRNIDHNDKDSPYGSVYFYDQNLPHGQVGVAELPSRNIIFEFDIKPGTTPGKEGEPNAFGIQVVSRLS